MKGLVQAICELDSNNGDTIYWLCTCDTQEIPKFRRDTESLNRDIVYKATYFAKAADIVAAFDNEPELQQDLIILFDVRISNIQNSDHLNLDMPLPNKWRFLAGDSSRNNVICIYSSEEAAFNAELRLGQNVRIKASAYNLQSEQIVHACSIVQESLILWNSFCGNWFESFLNASKSNGWFSLDVDVTMPHEFSSIKDRDAYKKELEKAVDSGGSNFRLPGEWFSNNESFLTLHENLKHLCGLDYNGLNENGARTLSIGAIFLIAMFSYYHKRGSIEPFTKSVTSWNNYDCITSPFLGPQPIDYAKKTAVSLFNFFSLIFENKIENNKIGCNILNKGKLIEFSFDEWEYNGFFKKLERMFPLSTPEKVINTTTSLLKLFHYMLFQTNGFLHPGHIYMEEGTLYVGIIGE